MLVAGAISGTGAVLVARVVVQVPGEPEPDAGTCCLESPVSRVEAAAEVVLLEEIHLPERIAPGSAPCTQNGAATHRMIASPGCSRASHRSVEVVQLRLVDVLAQLAVQAQSHQPGASVAGRVSPEPHAK